MLTIITVVFNDSIALEKTIQSIDYNFESSRLNFNDINFVVIDGGSDDNTIEVIKSCDKITSFISEADSGIYDAMNKGINLSTGDWILFLNAGDTLEDHNVLSYLLSKINNAAQDVNMFYGSYKSDGEKHKQVCSLLFLVSRMINHQSIIYHRSLLKHGYDLRYRFCADYAHLLSVWPQLKPKALDLCIANFDTTGVSSQASNKARMWQERLQAVWRSDLEFTHKILLSSRGLMAWPYHYLKNWFVRLKK